MARLYNRDIRVTAGDLEIAPRTASGETQPALAAKFSVLKTDNREKNKARLTLFNLAERTRAKLQERRLPVEIEAGYVEEISRIFKGSIHSTTISRTETEWVTEVEMTDGGKAGTSARINESFRGTQSVGQMLKKAAASLGLDAGNLDEKVSLDGARSILKEFVSGFVLSGSAEDVVDKLAESMGLKFSIQDGSSQFLGKGEVLPGPPVFLTAGTGLIGSPSVGEKGVVKLRCLLNGLILPGRLIEVDSAVVSAELVTKQVRHTGATWGSDWTTQVEAVTR